MPPLLRLPSSAPAKPQVVLKHLSSVPPTRQFLLRVLQLPVRDVPTRDIQVAGVEAGNRKPLLCRSLLSVCCSHLAFLSGQRGICTHILHLGVRTSP